ncbi:hypothetical protein HYT56_00420 [Candidatus Woesearchaeota archaeon]|nr:hypothetical protein [Candidatus Woesearchaeota archaeon]
MLKILAVIGLILSMYSFYVGKNLRNRKYKPLCDINKKISCSRAFSSKYGKILGEANSYYGIIFYSLIFLLAVLNFREYIFFLSVLSVFGSVYLAYISYIKIKTYCLVCTSIYLINILLLIFSI